MPLFGNQQNQAAQIWEPKAADGRLAQPVGRPSAAVFTSELSVLEYVLLGEARFEPLGFVAGSSFLAAAPRSGGSPRSTGCPTPHPSPLLRSAWTN